MQPANADGQFSDGDVIEVLKLLRLWDTFLEVVLGDRVEPGPAPGSRARTLVGPQATPRLQSAAQARRQLLLRMQGGARFPSVALNPTITTSAAERQLDSRVLSLRLNASSLSEGQIQRLGLARVLLRRPRLAILDECTSGIDPITAALVQVVTRRFLHDSCVIQVTHRLGVVMGCDQIVLLDKGRIEEVGRPLILANDATSQFAKLVKIARSANKGKIEY